MKPIFLWNKRAFALLLSLALLLSALGPGGVSAAEKYCACGEIPRVYVDGIGAPLYRNAGTPEQSETGVVEPDGLKDAVLPMATNIIQAAARRDWSAGAEAIAALARGLFGHLQCDEAGESIQPISNPYLPVPEEQNHKEDNRFGFRYDWRLDPMQSARELDEYIKLVQAATGHKKVALIYYSEGAVIAMAYAAQFGYAALDHMIPVVAAHNGLSLVGELFNKNIQIDGGAVANLLRSFIGSEGGMALLGSLVTVLERAGLFDALCGALQLVVDNTGDRLFETTLTPLFAQWPALWGFVPDAYYESAKAAVLDSRTHAELIRKLDDYHYSAGARTNELLAAAVKAGVKVSIVSAYGYPSMPFFAGANVCADGLIDTALESCGATCADYGTALPEGYTQKNADGHDHISPNGQIDASTCAFPEQTWFLRGELHFAAGDDALFDFLVYSKGQPTVHRSGDFPQFMFRTAQGALVPDNDAPAAEELPATLLAALWQLLTGAVKLMFGSIG